MQRRTADLRNFREFKKCPRKVISNDLRDRFTERILILQDNSCATKQIVFWGTTWLLEELVTKKVNGDKWDKLMRFLHMISLDREIT